MKEKFRRFMTGRYGTDQFSQFLMVAALLIMLMSLFVRVNVIYWIAIVLIIYAYFRVFSRNYSKRYSENQMYLKYSFRVRNFWGKIKYKVMQRKQYHIYRCPNCRQKIRIPRGKGKIEIRCPKCGTEFVKRS
ncbi:MAG TPA: hypothetical protein PLU43_07790 [Lachnospiraceae bacterium]|nr:hypothetical protein [Lachnospiraceae bacterium]